MSTKNDKKLSEKDKKWERYDFIAKIVASKLEEQGFGFSMARMAEFLGVSASKIQKWKEGQVPAYDDLQMIAQSLGLSSEWLLLGVGDPIYKHKSPKFNPDYVDICDTLFEWLRYLGDPREVVAIIGGLRIEELNDCMESRTLPPLTAIARWIHYYKLNANFLIAQIGSPFLSTEEYKASGPLARIRERRDDFSRYTDDEAYKRPSKFPNGAAVPSGRGAEKELIHIVNDLMGKVEQLKTDIEHQVIIASADMTNEINRLKDDIISLQRQLTAEKDENKELLQKFTPFDKKSPISTARNAHGKASEKA